MKLYLFIRIIIIYGYECLVPVLYLHPPLRYFTLFSSSSIPLADTSRHYEILFIFCGILAVSSLFKFSLMYISLWLGCGLDNFQFLPLFFCFISTAAFGQKNFTCGWCKIDCLDFQIYVRNIFDTSLPFGGVLLGVASSAVPCSRIPLGCCWRGLEAAPPTDPLAHSLSAATTTAGATTIDDTQNHKSYR